jgi:O-antigen/teichoic acid export membrane protein
MKTFTNWILNKIGQTPFTKNILVLMSGTTTAQIISLLVTPILTRLFSPEEFGNYALFITITSILSILISLRYELAIMLPKEEKDARSIVKLSLIISLIISSFLIIIIFVFNKQISILLSLEALHNWLYAVPVLLLSMGIYQIFNNYNNRINNYKDISKGIVLLSASSSSMNLIFGFAKSGSNGLIGGYSISQLLAALFISKKHIKSIITDKSITCSEMMKQVKIYNKFPIFDLPNAISYSFSSKGLVFVIVNNFGELIIGFYTMTERLLIIPFSFFTNAFSQAYFEKISKLSHVSLKHIGVDVNKTIDKLIGLLIIPFGMIILLSKPMIPIILGREWALMYPYVYILAPIVFLTLILSPLSHIFKIINKQQIALVLNISNFGIRIGVLVVAPILFDNPLAVFFVFSVVSSIGLIFNAWYTNRLILVGLPKYLKYFIGLLIIYYSSLYLTML